MRRPDFVSKHTKPPLFLHRIFTLLNLRLFINNTLSPSLFLCLFSLFSLFQMFEINIHTILLTHHWFPTLYLYLTMELSLDLSLDFSPKTIPQILLQLSSISDSFTKRSKLDDYLKRLEDEMRKIDAFKRELPLCVLLLQDGGCFLFEFSSHFTICLSAFFSFTFPFLGLQLFWDWKRRCCSSRISRWFKTLSHPTQFLIKLMRTTWRGRPASGWVPLSCGVPISILLMMKSQTPNQLSTW